MDKNSNTDSVRVYRHGTETWAYTWIERTAGAGGASVLARWPVGRPSGAEGIGYCGGRVVGATVERVLRRVARARDAEARALSD